MSEQPTTALVLPADAAPYLQAGLRKLVAMQRWMDQAGVTGCLLCTPDGGVHTEPCPMPDFEAAARVLDGQAKLPEPTTVVEAGP